jgi:DNA-binding GntR family transcriptional regulator
MATKAGRGKLPASLTETAYRRIKEEILSNRLRPGDPVESERFVRGLNLSRTPVREAVLRLQKEGFIEIRPRMGTFVSHLDLRQIQEMYQVRRTLEGLAARLAAGTVDARRLEALESGLKSLDTGAGADLNVLSAAGGEVHQLILDFCANRVLAEMISSLHDHFRRFRSLSLRIREKVLASHREHLDILDALRRGDGETAERLVHAHFDHAARSLLDSLMFPGGGNARVTVVPR